MDYDVLMIFLSFFIFMFIGVPLSFVLGLSGIIYLLMNLGKIPWGIIPIRLFAGSNNFILLAVPFFILAGNIINKAGVTSKLIRFAQALVGYIKGGLAMVNVVVSMFFAGTTGAAIADTSAVGTILIPAMKDEGYDADFSCGITAVSSTIGPIIPPSIAFVLYGGIAGVSIGKLFMGGLIPGLLLGIFQMIVAYYYSIKRDYPKKEVNSLKDVFKELLNSFFDAIPGLMIPVIIIGGIIGGIFTPTEAAAIAVFYSLLLGMVFYRTIKIIDLKDILIESAVSSAVMMILVSTAYLFGYALSRERIAVKLASLLVNSDLPIWLILLLVDIFLLIVGMFLDSSPAIIITAPILAPALIAMGLHPIQVGVIIVLGLVIGLSTPPIGVCLFMASSIGEIPLEDVYKGSIPFTLASILVLLLVTYLPFISTLFLPLINI